MAFVAILMVFFVINFHVSSASTKCDENCQDKPVFTPSRLVAKYGDRTSAVCSVCDSACNNIKHFGLEVSVGQQTINGTTISWTVERMTEWDTEALCYYNDVTIADHQCCSILPVTIYQPPDKVSISLVNHTGPMLEGHQYTLECTVYNVTPAENLTVTFYRGQTAMGQPQPSKKKSQKPETETFTMITTAYKEDSGVQYWCEAKLDIGLEGPQPPPVVGSQNITAPVYYMPQFKGPPYQDPFIIKVGDPLHLNCSAVGNPIPSYTWTLPSDRHRSPKGSVFSIESITHADKGQYICSASNTVGTVAKNSNVDVQAKDYGYIIAGVIISLVIVILFVSLYLYCYKQNRMGRYNPRDVFRFRQHSAVPTVE